MLHRFRSRTTSTPATSPAHAEIPDRVSIFVTVGTELPFDRLIGAVDGWAGDRGRDDVFAQIGETATAPEHLASAPALEATTFRRLFDDADLIVAHAGMGTILGALERARPLVVVPRRAELGEHRNDHQLATTEQLERLGLINVVNDEHDLIAYLDDPDSVPRHGPIGASADPSLIEAVRSAIHRGG